ncbi:lysozyme inhibitor LprI family protein [Taklimakanibacter deserti]|uniref:lysozyme inhibitor LprI family protein n=1 Tax=Taklimakanibacter deserti TaxID=2267839 RepID=UPI000E645E60
MTRYLFLLLSALILFVSPVEAASFDCSKAAKPDERAICATPDLSALDSEMGGLWFAFSKVPMLMGSNGARMDDAQNFLQQRAQCGGDLACLRQLYRARIDALKQGIVRAMDDYARLQNGDPAQ